MPFLFSLVKQKAQGIDPEPSVPDRNALFVKMPGSYRTRLVSPVAPGMSSHLSTPLDEDGLKFGAPNMDLIVKFDNRGDTLVDQAAKLIMRDGKLTVARSVSVFLCVIVNYHSPFILETNSSLNC